MPTRTFTIYEVPNSYVSTGTAPTISGTFTMVVTDDDTSLDATAAADTGAAQSITVDGGAIDSFTFFYDDTITIGGGTETVKTFQLTIGGTTRSFVMSDNASTIPGAGVGVGFTLNSYSNYTPLNYTSLPCFARGTRIRTPHGEKPIQDIKAGDMVLTQDEGYQPVRWIGSTSLSQRDLIARAEMRPILISRGALGGGLPHTDLRVSPQHRVLMGGWQVALHFGHDEILAPAKSLTDRPGINVDEACTAVEYHHMMFDRHHVVFSEGLATESFLVGDTIRDSMDEDQLKEILALFPELAHESPGASAIPARPILKSFEAGLLEPACA